MIFKLARAIRLTVHRILKSKMELKTVAFFSLGAVLKFYFGLSSVCTLLSVFGTFLVTGGYKITWVIIRTFPRDMRALVFLLRSKREARQFIKNGDTIATIFEKNVKRHPDKLCYIMVDGKQYTFQEVDQLANRVGNYFYSLGYRYGDRVAVFLENSAEYVPIWLGLSKIGCVPALINWNLRSESLVHCIKVSSAKAVIFSTELRSALIECQSHLPEGLRLFCFGDNPNDNLPSEHLDPQLAQSSTVKPPCDKQVHFNETLFYIYTSGTTGMPKAAIVIHNRYYYMAQGVHNFFRMNSDSVVYDTLPLYHSAGGIVGVGQALVNGCTVVIRKKFSASRFWDDCVKYNCTAAQYIGEIARYLLAQPVRDVEKQHRVRMVYGNGLRPQIWELFQRRFHIDRIGEFYGATEGNANMINTDNTVGAVGFTTRLAPRLYPVMLIKVDEVTGEPIRDRDGMCIRCGPNEPGELVGKIIKGDPLREFDGYADKAATEKKIANNVFTKGDSAFLTGDVLVMDDYGYFFFRDRTGDTFRWKGENVSTAEVEATVSNITHLTDAVAYGVDVPGAEGKAGMVAILDEDSSLDLKALYTNLQKALPAYARPIFVRKVAVMDTTGTFKLRKVDYRKIGFDPSKTGDRMFYLDARAGEYKPIDKAVYQDISNGKIKF